MIINANVNKSEKRDRQCWRRRCIFRHCGQCIGKKVRCEPNLKEEVNDLCGYLESTAGGKVEVCLIWSQSTKEASIAGAESSRGKSEKSGRKMIEEWGRNEDHKGLCGPILGLDFSLSREWHNLISVSKKITVTAMQRISKGMGRWRVDIVRRLLK